MFSSRRRSARPPARNGQNSDASQPRAQAVPATAIPLPAPEQRRYSPVMSHLSTKIADGCLWHASDFRLAASLVIIQPSSGKLVLVHDTEADYWFLPRGRKDINESIEDTALREGYEESGYQATFLPLITGSRAVVPSELRASDDKLRVEPLFIRLIGTPSVVNQSGHILNHGDEYICFFYVGQIPADAVRVAGTGMADEQAYVGKLVTFEEALSRLQYDRFLVHVVHTAYETWLYTQRVLEEREKARVGTTGEPGTSSRRVN